MANDTRCPVCDGTVTSGAIKCPSCGIELTLFSDVKGDKVSLPQVGSSKTLDEILDLLKDDAIVPSEDKAGKIAPDQKKTPIGDDFDILPELQLTKPEVKEIKEKAVEPLKIPEVKTEVKIPETKELFECPACHTKIPVDSKSCPNCLSQFVEEATFECPICSTSVSIDVDKCPSCGALFVEEPAESATTVTQQLNPPSIEIKEPPKPVKTEKELFEEFSEYVKKVKPLTILAKELKINTTEIRKKIEEGIELGKKKEYEKTNELFKECLTELEKKIEETFQNFLTKQNESLQTLREFKVDIRRVEGLLNRARFHLSKKNYEFAHKLFKEAQEDSKKLEETIKEEREKLRTIERVIVYAKEFGADVDESEYLFNRGREALKNRETKKAEVLLDQAFQKAVIDFQTGFTKELSKCSNKLKELKIFDPTLDVRIGIALMKQANIFMKKKSYVEAVEVLKKFWVEIEKLEHKTMKQTAVSSKVETVKKELPTEEPKKETKLEKGYSYLVKEDRANKIYQYFKSLSSPKKNLCLTITYPQKIVDTFKLSATQIYWISETTARSDAIDPRKLEFEISAIVNDFIRNNPESAILIDGLDYLESMNTFELLVNFLKVTIDLASSNKCTVLVSVNPGAFDAKKIAILEGKFDRIIEE